MIPDQSPQHSAASFNLSHAFPKPGLHNHHHHQNQSSEAHSAPTGEHLAHFQHLQTLLAKRPGPEYLSTRPGAGGTKFVYIEAWKVIELANEIFGFNGWTTETKTIDVDYVDVTSEGKYNVGVSAIVRISLRDGSSHEDVGYGRMENCVTKGDALEKCKKEAVTDALKRTMRAFGNLLGNCLYDKTFLGNIKNMQPQKEKFLPSKLYRPEYANRSSTADSKPAPDIASKGPPESVTSTSTGQPTNPKPIHANPKPVYTKAPMNQPQKPSPTVKSETHQRRSDTFPPARHMLLLPRDSVAEVATTDTGHVLEHATVEYSSTPSDNFLDLDENDLAKLDADEQSMLQHEDVHEMTVDDSFLTTEPSILLTSTAATGDTTLKPFPQRAGPFHGAKPAQPNVNLGTRPSTSCLLSNNTMARSATRPPQAANKALQSRAPATHHQQSSGWGPLKTVPIIQAGQLPNLRGGAAGALNNSITKSTASIANVENQSPDDIRGVKRSLDRGGDNLAPDHQALGMRHVTTAVPATRVTVPPARAITTAGHQTGWKSGPAKWAPRPQPNHNPVAHPRSVSKVSDPSLMAEQPDGKAPKKIKT